MKKRAAGKSSAADLLVSPLPMEAPHGSCNSPKQFNFNLKNFNTSSSSKKKSLASTSLHIQPPRSPPPKTLNTISDLKDFHSTRSQSIKRHLDLSHSEILKEIQASQSRLSKRFKIQTLACQKVMDEAEKEYKKMSDRISESVEVMKASYSEFITEAQATTSRVCKTSIPELTESLEKAIEVLRNRYGISST
ncbi:hypothetical protein HHK36_028284 [Tetracentron sinense]|uniref:Uncharacterized protein n=1 Tax=Tetracentron sinense TaxID=13715 RepID=A0A834YKS9_TETSI|nr:hypothetical protein HHK36_028284 [Tetracentron sinense]